MFRRSNHHAGQGLAAAALFCATCAACAVCAEPRSVPEAVRPGVRGLLTAKVDSLTPAVAPRPLPPAWNAAWPHAMLAPRPGGGSALAWNGADGALRVTALSEQNAPQGSDRAFPSATLGGFTLTPDGYAILSARDSTFSVVSVGPDGNEAFRALLIGDKPRNTPQAKFDPMHFGSARLLFAGGRYAAYFAHQQNWNDTAGKTDIHQGDMLVFLDAAGQRLAGGWNWGTSHSLDQRLIHDGANFVTASIGDAYPKGMTFQRVGAMSKVTVMEVWGNMLGKANALFGNLVQLGPGLYALAFASPEGRDGSWDAGVLYLNAAGAVLRRTWLTALPAADDKGVEKVNAARFGAGLLVAWSVRDSSDRRDSTFAAALDTAGRTALGPDYLPEGFGRGDDFVNFSNGDVGWAYARGGKLRVVRVPLVTPSGLRPAAFRFRPRPAAPDLRDLLGRRIPEPFSAPRAARLSTGSRQP